MRIAIVNDSLTLVEAMRQLVAPRYPVAWSAMDGVEALERCRIDRPDLILMDLMMPRMNGVEATRRIVSQFGCPVLVVTASVEGASEMVFEALGAGAMDAVKTPMVGLDVSRSATASAFLAKIETMERLTRQPKPAPDRQAPRSAPVRQEAGCPLVLLGSSSGGPGALARVLSRLPRDLGAAVLIAQHLDREFFGGLADWLNGQSALPVALAAPGQAPEPGKALVVGFAPRVVLNEKGLLQESAGDTPTPFFPCIDVLFESVARNWSGPVCAVVMTGMGRDGARGLQELKARGHLTLAQDEESSAIFGMPRAALQSGAASKAVPLDELAEHLERFVLSTRRPRRV